VGRSYLWSSAYRFVGELDLSTIEKALQKQREKEALAAQIASAEAINNPVPQSTQTNVEPEKQAPIIEESIETQVANSSKNFIHFEPQGEEFVSAEGRRVLNEEFRAIKRKILSNAFGPLSKTLNNSNIIMVSSANPNEGKTFTAINLALSIALEQDKTVLLVDADVLRPSVMKVIGQGFDNGLTEYLLGDVESMSEVIYRTSLDTLRIIPAGKSHHLSSELLASTKMVDAVNEFANRYPDRVVIIDSPPLLGINETAILANLAGQAVVVVEEGKSNLNKVALAVEQLNPDMAKGFVINKSRRNNKEGAGYYGYYYGADAND
jgi:protein-tyrosine kinase